MAYTVMHPSDTDSFIVQTKIKLTVSRTSLLEVWYFAAITSATALAEYEQGVPVMWALEKMKWKWKQVVVNPISNEVITFLIFRAIPLFVWHMILLQNKYKDLERAPTFSRQNSDFV